MADRHRMEHALGGMLIAADSQTAAELATRHGLASVTLDGRISRPGSLQGGWQGSLPNRQTASTLLELSNIQVQMHDQMQNMIARALVYQAVFRFTSPEAFVSVSASTRQYPLQMHKAM